jgi:hypothetical protein
MNNVNQIFTTILESVWNYDAFAYLKCFFSPVLHEWIFGKEET